MSVKTIFKVILGTIATIVISSLVIELFNLELQSMQMTKLINVSGKQAAALFAQETYKSDSGAGSANMPNLRTTDGGVYVSGNFYNGTSEASIYNSIYTSSEFRNWVGANRGKWLSVDCIASGLGLGSGGLGPNEITFNFFNPITAFATGINSLIIPAISFAVPTGYSGIYALMFLNAKL